MKRRIRKAVALFHLWTGFIVGLYFVVLGVTGSFLVFRSDVEEAMAPELRHVAPAGKSVAMPLSAIVGQLRKGLPNVPEASLNSVAPPRHPGGAYTLSSKSRFYTIDPYTGRVIREVDLTRNFVDIVGNLHMTLLWEAKGMVANTVGGIAASVLVASGIWLWWPATVGQIRSRLTVKRGASLKRALNDLHNVFGLYGLSFLLMASLTGAVFGVWGPVQDALYRATGARKPPEAPATVPIGKRRLSIDRLVSVAEGIVPEARLAGITFPAKPDAPFSGYSVLDEGRSEYATFSIDPYTGRVLHVMDARTEPAAGQIMRWIHFLHLGLWGGMAVKILYAVLGLLPLGLYVTGVGRYVLRRRGKRP